MRPYPGSGLPRNKVIFNYRLSRARRVVENAFGILATRFRSFHRPISQKVEHIDAIIKAAVVLHDFLQEETSHFQESPSEVTSQLTALERRGRNTSDLSSSITDMFCAYSNSPVGSTSWQDAHIRRVM